MDKEPAEMIDNENTEEVEIWFDADVLTALQSTGPDWQTLVNDILREWLEQQRSGR